MSDREPSEFNEVQMVLIPVLVEAVCVTVAISCAIALVGLLSMPWPV